MFGFRNNKLKENFDRISNPRKFLNEVADDSLDYNFKSNIVKRWTDPDHVRSDVRDFLLRLEEHDVQDVIIDDMINAMQNGINDYNELSNRV